MAKSWIGYALYALALTAALLYVRFPADDVERYLTHQFARRFPGAELIVGEVRPALPPGLILEPVGVTRNETPVLRLDRVRLTPALFSLAGDRPETDVDVRAFGGRLEGTVTLARSDGGSRPDALEVRIADIDLAGVGAIQNLSPHAVTGRLDGEADYDAGDGTATLRITDGAVVFAEPVFNLDRLGFSAIEARLGLAGDRTLRVEECTLAGNQVGGMLAGTIEVQTPLSNSVLDLRGELRPHPALIASLGEGAALLLRQQRNRKAIAFTVRGPVSSPRFSLN